MAYAFDTLGFSKRLRDGGVPQTQAEAHAEAARDFIMTELVTKTDLQTALTTLEGRLDAKIENLALKLNARTDLLGARIDSLSLQLTVRLGIMLVAAVSLLAAILKLA